MANKAVRRVGGGNRSRKGAMLASGQTRGGAALSAVRQEDIDVCRRSCASVAELAGSRIPTMTEDQAPATRPGSDQRGVGGALYTD